VKNVIPFSPRKVGGEVVTATQFKIVEGSQAHGFVCAVDDQMGQMLHLDATTGLPLYQERFRWVGPFYDHSEHGIVAPVRIPLKDSELASQAFKEQYGHLEETFHIRTDGKRV